MSTLTYSHDADLGAEFKAAENADKAARRPFWRRAFEAIIAARQKHAEREVAAYLASRGGLLTDDMERDIMQRLSGNPRRSV